jgi:hypothetical protein
MLRQEFIIILYPIMMVIMMILTIDCVEEVVQKSDYGTGVSSGSRVQGLVFEGSLLEGLLLVTGHGPPISGTAIGPELRVL